MIDNSIVQLALRARALTLSVATTGSMALAATTTGYSRLTGSFLADGFVIGQEVTPVGFATNTVGTVTAVSALSMTISGGRTAEASAGGRTLRVGLPSAQSWENVLFTPTTGRPYIEEQYVPGPVAQVTIGPLGDIEFRGLYVLHVYAPSNTGISADGKYADRLLDLFAPRTAIALSNGDVIRIRSDVAPYRGQRVQPEPGWSLIPVNIPFRLRTANSI